MKLALMSLSRDDGESAASRARQMMFVSTGAWHDLGYLIALRADMADEDITVFADKISDLEGERQCKDVERLRGEEEQRRGADLLDADDHGHIVAQALIWFLVERGRKPPSPWR
ncbi:hypothetical protein [Actinomadura sp. K4S16]|uniref:hypothetical protein n=1 Tax=Actinomadura sp. K4S16 TaxID=1316147 RepID=UPI0011EE5458|nr:hypothetical protein [Actinomadura sp. K4S16]